MIKAEIFLPQSINVEKLENDLRKTGLESMSAVDMRIFGRHETSRDMYRGVERVVRHSQKIKVEIIMQKQSLNDVLEVLKERVSAEYSAGIKIFTSPVGNSLPCIEFPFTGVPFVNSRHSKSVLDTGSRTIGTLSCRSSHYFQISSLIIPNTLVKNIPTAAIRRYEYLQGIEQMCRPLQKGKNERNNENNGFYGKSNNTGSAMTVFYHRCRSFRCTRVSVDRGNEMDVVFNP